MQTLKREGGYDTKSAVPSIEFQHSGSLVCGEAVPAMTSPYSHKDSWVWQLSSLLGAREWDTNIASVFPNTLLDGPIIGISVT